MIKIRKALKEDYEQLPAVEGDAAQLFAVFGLSEILSLEPSPVSFYEGLPETSLVLVAADKDKVVGFAVFLVIDGQGFLHELSVRRAYARQGLGRGLVAAGMDWALGAGFTALTLTTFPDLPFNGLFYEKLGFKRFDPDPRFWPALCQIREKEKAHGLEIRPRVAMRLDLRELSALRGEAKAAPKAP